MLTLDSVETNEFGARYIIGVERQAAPQFGQRAKRQHYASVGDKNDAFTITAKRFAGQSHTVDLLRLTDTGETATLSKDKPFHRVDGYMADLKYDPEGKSWQDQRVNDILKFDGDDYIIVAIEHDGGIIREIEPEKNNNILQSLKS